MTNIIDASNVSISTSLTDITGFAKTLALRRAAESGLPTTVILPTGVTSTQMPPPRPTDILQTAMGSPPPSRPTEKRSQLINEGRALSEDGNSTENDEDVPNRGGSLPVNEIFPNFGTIRESLGNPVIPTMEALMFNVPQAAIQKFTSLLPPVFKSLLPLGAVGNVAAMASKGPVSLSGLSQLVGGAALGTVAGQAIRSLSGGVNAVQGLSGALGAQAISRVRGFTAVPVNIGTTFGSALVGRAASGTVAGIAQSLGSTPQTSAVLANVIGTVTNVALNRNLGGIPLSPQILGLAANVALKTAGVPTRITTSVLGLAASSGVSPLASLIGSTVSGRVPVLPGNLSLPNVGALSGITQNLSPGLAERLIPSSQLGSLLPGNLQSQIPAVSPRLTNPGAINDIQARQQAASQSVPKEDLRPVTKPGPAKPAILTGTGGGRIPYDKHISPGGITLAMVSTEAVHSKHEIVANNAGNGLSIDQVIAGLSWVATNILDPIFEGRPGWQINSGFRGDGGSNPKGDHGRGAAIDFKWKSKSRGEHLRICQWIRQQGLPVDHLIYEIPGNRLWIHVSGGPNSRGIKKTQTFVGRYLDGLVG